MSSRYEPVPAQVYKMVEDVIHRYTTFDHLQTANILILFDTKKRKSGGRFVFGSIKKASDLEKALYNDPEGAFGDIDYILFLDKEVFNAIDDEDKIRIIRHELQHTDVHPEKGNFLIRQHEINDFYDEIEFNKDDPRWLERVSSIAESIYDEN